jgi:FKBP-type peptidyl-prolyl cis-trans isomerase FklB
MIVSQELQAIAQSSNNFQNLTPEDGDKVVEGIASLYYTLFINDPSFSNLDIEQYQKGLKEYWKTQKIENEQALAEEYFTYKATFSKDLGKKFLAKNKLRPEVTETESGLQYEVLQEGSGANPSDTNEVTVHYQGELIDGKIFDSSYQRGETISFGLNQVIKGWTEGLQLMNNGAKYRLYIPYEIGYGERGTQGIPPFATLIFDVELFSFK